nr:hypothetical protein CTI12_AA223780 [Tanacetum cinerariifolium]
ESRKLEPKTLEFNQEAKFLSMERSKKFRVEQAFYSSGSSWYPIEVRDTIKGKLTYGSVSNVSRIQAKELFVWLSVTGMDLDVGGDMVEFHVGVLSKKLPVDMFRDVPECKSKACMAFRALFEVIIC